MRTLCFCLLALAGCKNTDSLPGATVYDLSFVPDLMPPPDLMPLPGVITGKFGGIAFQPTSAMSANGMLGSGGTLGLIYLMDKPTACQQLSMSPAEQPKNITGVIIFVANYDGASDTPPSAPGPFPITTGGSTPGPQGSLKFIQTDAACMTVSATIMDAVSGTINITSIAGENYAGNWDVMMQHAGAGPMDHVTGEFHATKCAGLAALTGSNPTCN